MGTRGPGVQGMDGWEQLGERPCGKCSPLGKEARTSGLTMGEGGCLGVTQHLTLCAAGEAGGWSVVISF